jgi:cytochrome oxidase Cu insertion factor (SCO1/SenC/PrrC family)
VTAVLGSKFSRLAARIVCAGTVATALVAMAALSPVASHPKHGAIVQQQGDVDPSAQGYKPPDPATLGGPFAARDHNGEPVTYQSWPGKWLVMFFGFAGCREACPVGLDAFTLALEQMGADAEKIQPLFVELSMAKQPDYKGLKQFVSNFHPSVMGIAGSRAETFDLVRAFQVRREYGHSSYSKRETGPRLNHTTYFYVLAPDGRVKGYFYHNLAAEKMVAALRQFMAQ